MDNKKYMFKYLILLISLFFISCTDISQNHIGEKGEKCYDDGSCDKGLKCIEGVICSDPCDDINCSDHGRCILDENYNPECICDNYYKPSGLNCIMDDDNPCLSKECQENASCELEDDKEVCKCNSGYMDKDGVCIIDETSCSKECVENSHCVLVDDLEVCKCNSGYTSENGICRKTGIYCDGIECGENMYCRSFWGRKICDCKDGFQDNDNDGNCSITCSGIVCPDNSTHCDDSTGEVECVCNSNTHLDGDICVSSIKELPCDSTQTPNNAISIDENVEVTWNEDTHSWTPPANCSWNCKDGYQDNDNNGACLPACSNNDNFCTAAYTHCDDSTGTIQCKCNDDFHIEGVECVSNRKMVSCDSSQIPRDNATFIITVVTVTWDENTHSWSSPEVCEWSCDSGYEYNENDNICVAL